METGPVSQTEEAPEQYSIKARTCGILGSLIGIGLACCTFLFIPAEQIFENPIAIGGLTFVAIILRSLGLRLGLGLGQSLS